MRDSRGGCLDPHGQSCFWDSGSVLGLNILLVLGDGHDLEETALVWIVEEDALQVTPEAGLLQLAAKNRSVGASRDTSDGLRVSAASSLAVRACAREGGGWVGEEDVLVVGVTHNIGEGQRGTRRWAASSRAHGPG